MSHPRPKRVTHLSSEMRVIWFALSGPAHIFRNIMTSPSALAHLIVHINRLV
jgi:hypothetical protein